MVVEAPDRGLYDAVRSFVNVWRARSCELQSECGTDDPIPEFSGPNAAGVTSDGTRREVVWPARQSGKVDYDGPFSIKATLPGAGDVRVYAVYAISLEG